MLSQSRPFVREQMPYRDGVGIVLFNAEGRVMICRRVAGDAEDSAQHAAPWQMPQGGIDKGETPIQTARRELFEETNVASLKLLAEASDWTHYDLPDSALGIGLHGKYRGQRHRWFAFLFTGKEREIDVIHPGGGKFKPEFDQWRWESLSKTPDLIVPFKRPAYIKMASAFARLPEQLASGMK